MSNRKPVIPLEEYPKRWVKVQGLMKDQDLDLLIAYADDHAVFGPAHCRWLANIPIHFEPVCILFHQTGQPIVLCGPESPDYIRHVGQIQDVRVLEEFCHPNEDYPHTKIESLAEIISDIMDISAVKRIGLAGGDLMGAPVYLAFKNVLKHAEWVDVENAVCMLRAIKTPAEMEVIRYAYEIAEIGFRAAVEAIRPGVTEREVAAVIEGAMRKAGAEGTGIDTMVGSGPNSRTLMCRTTFREIGENELVQVTVAPRYEGYHGAIGRPVLVGKQDSRMMEALEAAIHAEKTCAQNMVPGVEGRLAEAKARKIMEAAGYGESFLYSGIHSVGVIEFEPPIFGPSQAELIGAGMVLSIDIPVFNTPWGGFRIENGYYITENGSEPLTNIDYIIQK
jgi:Xaa-Pro aminopeptidase